MDENNNQGIDLNKDNSGQQNYDYQAPNGGQPDYGYQAPNPNPGSAPKSKIVAGLLGIFLGGWGIHRFYLGYTKMGIIQIIVTLVTCGAASLWGVIEGILILCGTQITTDANGNPLQD